MSTDTDEVCAKCGQTIDLDNEDSHPEPLCFGCSHGQDSIDEAQFDSGAEEEMNDG